MSVDTTTAPTLTGPISGGRHGWIFGQPVEDLAQRGYAIAEYFLEGEAQAYRPAAGAIPGPDGVWATEPGERARYKTRLYVVRPTDPAKFNGVVVFNWQNVTANLDLGFPSDDEIFRGYAWVGITTQKIGVDGVEGLTQGLRAWDPERYGSLHHPGDQFSYDIYAQAARMVADPQGPNAPLAGLKPTTLIATGGSQSAMRLGSYINAAHQHDQLFDAFLLTVHWGMCPPLDDISLQRQFKPMGGGLYRATAKIRDDQNVPILSLAGESECLHNFPVRQPDSATYRFWELAGAAHSNPGQSDMMAKLMARDGIPGRDPAVGRNIVEWGYVKDAALRAIVTWVRTAAAPASLPLVEIDASERGFAVRRDSAGNALGGVRLPEMTAPSAAHNGSNDLDPIQALSGASKPFTQDQLKALYPDAGAYVARWDEGIDGLLKVGAILPEDVARERARGRRIAADLGL